MYEVQLLGNGKANQFFHGPQVEMAQALHSFWWKRCNWWKTLFVTQTMFMVQCINPMYIYCFLCVMFFFVIATISTLYLQYSLQWAKAVRAEVNSVHFKHSTWIWNRTTKLQRRFSLDLQKCGNFTHPAINVEWSESGVSAFIIKINQLCFVSNKSF